MRRRRRDGFTFADHARPDNGRRSLRVPFMPAFNVLTLNAHMGFSLLNRRFVLPELREAHRQRQLRMLCEVAHDAVPAGTPLVVAGDFNDWRQRGHGLMAQCSLVEVFEAAHGRVARTFPARLPLLPVDRIYVRDLHASQPRVLGARPWSHLSDHVPLLARVSV